MVTAQPNSYRPYVNKWKQYRFLSKTNYIYASNISPMDDIVLVEKIDNNIFMNVLLIKILINVLVSIL